MTTFMRGRFGTPMKIEKDGRQEGTTKLGMGDPTATRQMFASPATGGTTARPHDPSGNEPNFDELIGTAAIAAATLGSHAPRAQLGAR